jgi:hypothetical protein
MSSQNAICPGCGHEHREATEEELAIYRARRLRDRIYRLNMTSYLVITVFLAAFGWYWWESAGYSRMSSPGPFILMGIAAFAYLVVRVFIFRTRGEQKAMRQRRQMSKDLRRNL